MARGGHVGPMPVSPQYAPDPRLPALGGDFADPVRAADFPELRLRWRNARAASTVGLADLTDTEWSGHFGRFQPLPGNLEQPLAQRYHGHQFRVYNPDLGDGRGFTFAQLRETGTGRLLDLATKGSGVTPWSRSGDGRLTLKGGVREVLAAGLLEALGVPTSRAFSLIETGEALVRQDEPSPTRSAVLVRLSHSHVRYGTFQRPAALDRPDLVRRLLDYTLELYFPHRLGESDPGVALLEEACHAAAPLVAAWMAAGFVHGVLNTDNMNITGESFDYGPYRFLPHSDPNFVAAYFDHAGLYSFGRQPEAVFWNLRQLAGCLLAAGSSEDALVEVLNGFGDLYREALARAVPRRLGLAYRGDGSDARLVSAAFQALAAGGAALRWEPFFFDWFCGDAARALDSPRGEIYRGEAFDAFRREIAEAVADRPERLAHPYFGRTDPVELLMDAIEALWEPIATADDWSPFKSTLAAIETAREALDLQPS